MYVKALQKMYYVRRNYDIGDVYEMDDREEGEAKILALLGKVEIVKKPAVVEAPKYQAADLKPEGWPPKPEQATEATDSSDNPDRPRRTYRRRDMRPE
jgi:predicted alternative tryptophan synthase beta-subunit